MATQVARLPLPERIEPKVTKHSLFARVRIYYYGLYNGASSKFRDYLASVGNKDSLTGNRMFDRAEAVKLVLKEAETAKDSITLASSQGDIYSCIVKLMRHDGIGLKLRRMEYRRLAAPAE